MAESFKVIIYRSEKYNKLCFKCAVLEVIINNADIETAIEEVSPYAFPRCDKCEKTVS